MLTEKVKTMIDIYPDKDEVVSIDSAVTDGFIARSTMKNYLSAQNY